MFLPYYSQEEDPLALLSVNNLEEAKYLLEHFVSLAISKVRHTMIIGNLFEFQVSKD